MVTNVGFVVFFFKETNFFSFASCLKVEIAKLFWKLTSVNPERLLGAKNQLPLHQK